MGDKSDHKSDQPCEFSHDLIKQITDNFKRERIIGTGGFGTVYKGIENGREIAVKVLNNTSQIDSMDFQKEFENLRRFKHQNVVELVGFCNETESIPAEYDGKQVIAEQFHRALCLEYVCNGSLTKYISADERPGLKWHTRYKIIKGICDGLEYLRRGPECSVWHLDLKPDNILLDDNMIPKIADFGLSILLHDNNTRKTSNIRGTRGYMPPEYIDHGTISKEFDIFSLGVIIAKTMAGEKDYHKFVDVEGEKLIKHVHVNWRKRLRKTLLPRTSLQAYCEQVTKCIQIAVKCMDRDRGQRPNIQSIISALNETEIKICNLGPHTEQEDETILLDDRSPEMAAHSSEGQADEGKTSTARTLPKNIPLDDFKYITNNFADERIISRDEFGTLYKGILVDGEVIMVKKLAENGPVSSDKAFTTELQNTMNLKHEKLVNLLGYCHEVQKKVVLKNGRYIVVDVFESLLCYEYVPKGSLRNNLFGVPSKMDWGTRFEIIRGICQGLFFLHSIHIVHADLQTQNILLDNNMRPKIANFGLSRVFGKEQTHMNTQFVVGTKGYIAPEYLHLGEISTKLDIYSLGLLILETTTGEKNIIIKKEPSHFEEKNEPSLFEENNEPSLFVEKNEQSLFEERESPCGRRFIKSVEKNWTPEVIALKYESSNSLLDLEQVKVCIDIGLECVNIDQRSRPSIEEILEVLNGVYRSLPSPQPQWTNFPIESKRMTSSSLYLTNNTNDRIAFRLVTDIPKRYHTKLPFCGILPSNCTYTLVLIMHKEKSPPSNKDNFLILQSSIARHQDLDSVDPASVAKFLDSAGNEVKEVTVEAAYKAATANQIIDSQNYREVLSVDIHPTKPWILTSNQRGYVCIWNYQKQAEVNSIEVTRAPAYSSKFIERQEWFVVGSGDGYIYVYNYNTMEEVVDRIEAHDGHKITCLAVNPTRSFVLSASDDNKIKLWDWTNKWQCSRTFEGHFDTVTQVIFDPRNSESFASASLDQTVKIWNVHDATCEITWDGHLESQLCLHYYRSYFHNFLTAGSSDGAARVWDRDQDLERDRCVDTLQGHAKSLSAICWHPELRVLATGSLDGTVQIWKYTGSAYRLENIIGLNLGLVHALGYLKGLPRIVVGCDQGIALMEIDVM